jgi:Rps23 Pro-64 3,4-dihydroxylase Tpa1-like proline 4-hydroxylase
MINKQKDLDKIISLYSNSEGPKFVVIDELFENDFIKKCEEEFLQINESDFIHYQNPLFEFEKFALNDREKMPQNIRSLFEYIHSEEFVELINSITNISDLSVDEKRWGGGLHMTKKGGYLSIHKDFNILPTTYKDQEQMLRCVNLIGYLNSNWKEGDGGELEFWDDKGNHSVEKIEPKFNRWVIFDTRNNYHGHPYPYQGESHRISIASYYYTKIITGDKDWSSTEYLKLPWMEETEEYIKARQERADAKSRYKNILDK